MKASLRQVVIMIIASVLALGIIALNFIEIYKHARANLISQQQNEILRAAIDTNYVLDASVDAVRTTAYTIDRMMQNGTDTDENISEFLKTQSVTYTNALDPDFDGLYGVINGKYFDGVGWVPPEGYIPEERPWYRSALAAAGKVTLVTPYVDAQTTDFMMSVSCLLSDRQSVISLDVSLDGIQRLTENAAAKNGWTSAIIVDSDNNVIAHSDHSQVGVNLAQDRGSFNSLVSKSIREALKEPVLINHSGKTYLVFAADIDNSWRSVAVVEDVTLQSGFKDVNTLLIFSCVVVACLLGIVIYGVRKEHKKIRAVGEQVVTAGGMFEMAYLIDLKSDTNVEMDGVAQGLDVSENRIKQAQTKLRSIMDSITDERFKAAIFTFTNLETLQERLDGNKTVIREFTDTRNRRCCGRFVAMEYSAEGKLESVLWVVEVIGERRKWALP